MQIIKQSFIGGLKGGGGGGGGGTLQQYCILGYRDKFGADFLFVCFFYEKILRVKKAPKCKTNVFHLFRSFCSCEKFIAFVVFCWVIFVLLVGFCL